MSVTTDSKAAPLPGTTPDQNTPASPSWTIYAWVGTVPLIWGFNFVCLKIVYEVGFTVPAMLSVRYILMALSLGLLLLFEKDRRIAREDWKYLIVFALITVALYQYLFAKAIELTSAAESALLISTSPIWVFLISMVMKLEAFDRTRMIGVLVGFVGVGMVILGSGASPTVPATHHIGNLVMIASAILWAAYAIFSKPLLAKYSPMKIVAYIHILGAIILIPVGFGQMMEVNWATLGVVPWLSLLQYSVLAGVYGFIMWYRGVQKIGASQTMLFQYFVPPVALIASYLILKEIPTVLQVIGIVITLGGVHLARQRSNGPSAPAQAAKQSS